MSQYITTEELLYIAVIAFFITWFIYNVMKFKKIMELGTANTAVKDIKKILDRCYAMFPLEDVSFKGQTFRRGMRVKITTLQDKVFEGELIGTNYRNLVCIMTNRLVVAHELSNIRDITQIDTAEK
ncbi:MAG: hypothetical protein IKS17_02630 [Firmicutes bacterium]|nr:hypothetical protein [Bacillota bacterium]